VPRYRRGREGGGLLRDDEKRGEGMEGWGGNGGMGEAGY